MSLRTWNFRFDANCIWWKSAGSCWGQLRPSPALCQHDAHSDSACLGFFQNQNWLSRPTFREPGLDFKVYRYKNCHGAMNYCEFGWLGVLGTLKIHMCWGVGSQPQTSLQPSLGTRCAQSSGRQAGVCPTKLWHRGVAGRRWVCVT